MKFRGYLLNNFWIVASKASLKTITQVEDKWWYVRWSISALKPNQKLDKKQLSGNTTLDRTDCKVSSDNTSTKCGVCSRNLWIRCENFGCKQKNHFEVSQLRENEAINEGMEIILWSQKQTVLHKYFVQINFWIVEWRRGKWIAHYLEHNSCWLWLAGELMSWIDQNLIRSSTWNTHFK